MSKNLEASHRNSGLRKLQDLAAPHIEDIIRFLDRHGAFPDTNIHTVMSNRLNLLRADDITLTQLQMTKYICNTIEEKKAFPSFSIKYFLTSLLNGADGPIARRLGTTSKEGGIKDATVDRLTEIMIAELITKKLRLSSNLSHDLKVAFQLSTLTKAACEMSGVKTKEGGFGSMLERRRVLFFILKDLMKLDHFSDLKDQQKDKLLKDIHGRIDYLIKTSHTVAKERINLISEKTSVIEAPIDPDSSGASEARKYAGVVSVNNYFGIDIVSELNKLTEGKVIFPTIDQLIENTDYINRSLQNAKKFMDKAQEIVYPYLRWSMYFDFPY